jgi:putative transposase
MRAYSLDLRERIIGAVEAGQPADEIAVRFAVSPRTVRRYRQRWRAEGDIAARTSPGRPPRIRPDQYDALTTLVLALPDATLADYCQQWAATSGVRVSEATMCRVLQQLALTRKKSG